MHGWVRKAKTHLELNGEGCEGQHEGLLQVHVQQKKAAGKNVDSLLNGAGAPVAKTWKKEKHSMLSSSWSLLVSPAFRTQGP